MNDPTPDHDPSAPTRTQRLVLDGLRAACISTMILPPDQPAPNLPPGALIAWYTGLLSAAIDTIAARLDLYAPGELYGAPAVTGYSTGLGLLVTARPRLGMAYRLSAYSTLIHPPGLSASIDPATSAIGQAVTAASRMLLATGTIPAEPGEVAAEFRTAHRMLLTAARFAADVVRAHDVPGPVAGSGP